MNEREQEFLEQVESQGTSFLEFVKYLGEGNDVNATDEEDHTLLMKLLYELRRGENRRIFEFILENVVDLGVNLELENEFGNNIIVLCVVHLDDVLLEKMLKACKDARVGLKGKKFRKFGNESIFEILLSRHENVAKKFFDENGNWRD